MRIDKWLWHVRFFKTRSLATAAVRGGHARINGERAKPGTAIGIGDVVLLRRGGLLHEVSVVALPPRRGPARDMQGCYAESEASIERRNAESDRLRADRRLMPRTSGRPDKRTRRAIRSRSRDSDR